VRRFGDLEVSDKVKEEVEWKGLTL
jgi:hypothetical protein